VKRCACGLAAFAVLAGLEFVPPGATAQNAGQQWGTVKGQVVYGGPKVPEPEKLAVTRDQNHCLGKGPLFDEKWAVNKKNKGVRDVFLWLEDPAGNALPIHPTLKAIPQKQVVIDQPCCQFVPYAVALRQGQTLLVKNSAPVVHNIRYIGNPLVQPGASILLPPGGQRAIDLKAQDAVIPLACDIHPWMKGWVRVFDHPYFAVTNDDGKFEIKLAPAGPYRLKVWHPGSGWLGGPKGKSGTAITIRANQVTDVGDLQIKAR
jgi:hypothetical protein